MKIDLHSHTLPASPCSHITIEELVQTAKESGLDGVCLTEHNKPWDRAAVLRASETFDFPIFRGMEVTTKDGDILVFGLHEEIKEVLTAPELHDRVAAVNGYMIAAHPFRGFLMFGFPELSLKPEQAAKRPVFHAVNAIEAYNCKVSGQETQMAFELAAMLDLPCVAGSDAHKIGDVGKYATHFEKTIHDEEELIAELVAGRFSVDPPRS